MAGISSGVLPALGVVPQRGRGITLEEEVAGADLVLLSDGFWRQHSAADPRIVGRMIAINGKDAEVVGVLPPGFRLPEDVLSDRPAQLYFPMKLDPAHRPLPAPLDRPREALRGLLYEVSPTDPATLLAVAATLGLTALAACYLPARRATRTDPSRLLRTE